MAVGRQERESVRACVAKGQNNKNVFDCFHAHSQPLVLRLCGRPRSALLICLHAHRLVVLSAVWRSTSPSAILPPARVKKKGVGCYVVCLRCLLVVLLLVLSLFFGSREKLTNALAGSAAVRMEFC